MPKTEKQRRAVFSEIAMRKKGKPSRNFKGMDEGELKSYSKAPLDKGGKGKKAKGKRANPFSATDQAAALR